MSKKSESGGQGGGFMSLLIASMATGIVGFSAGYGVMSFSPLETKQVAVVASKPEATAHSKPAAEHGEKAAAAHGEDPVESPEDSSREDAPIDPEDLAFVALPPVITNVLDPKPVWLRLEGGITYLRSGEKKPELLASETAEAILKYLRTIKLTDFQGVDGLQFLIEDLNDTVRSVSAGQVRNVLITGLIVE